MSRQSSRVVPAAPLSIDEAADQLLLRVLLDGLERAERHEFRGTDYGNGVPAGVRRLLPPLAAALSSAAPRPTSLFEDVGVSGSTMDRLGVERYRDFEGTAQFALANLTCHDLLVDIGFGGTDGPGGAHQSVAARLVDWLVRHRSDGYHGFCGGRPTDRAGHERSERIPDVVSTAAGVEALLAIDDEDATDVAVTAGRYVTWDLEYRGTPVGTVVDPAPGAQGTGPPPVASLAAAARLLVSLYDATGADEYHDRATALLDTVAGAQTTSGGWSEVSPQRPTTDAVGVGRTLEALARYAQSCDGDRYGQVLRAGLDWYRSSFFATDGTPRASPTSAYPIDLRDGAQGVVTFTRVGALPFAERVLRSTLSRLYASEGRFHARTGQYASWRITPVGRYLAPILYAIATYLDAVRDAWRPREVLR